MASWYKTIYTCPLIGWSYAMVPEIMGHPTHPALTSHLDTSTNISKSWFGRQFEPNIIVSAWLLISMVDSLLCEDVAASTLPTWMVQIEANLIQLSTNSPYLIDWVVPCHAFLEHVDFPWRVKAERFLLPSFLSNPSEFSSYKPDLDKLLKTRNCLFWFLNLFSSIAILESHSPWPLFMPPLNWSALLTWWNYPLNLSQCTP